MSNGWNWELMRWADKFVHLTFWDSMKGEDVHIILSVDGAEVGAYEDGGDDLVYKPIVLEGFLINWLNNQEDDAPAHPGGGR